MQPSVILGRAVRAWQTSRTRYVMRLSVLRVAALRPQQPSGVANIFFHNISASEAAAFEQFLDALAPVPFVPMSQHPTGSEPPAAFTLSFDDGFRDHARIVAPILRRRGIPATLFIATGLVGLTDEALVHFTRRGLRTEEVLPSLNRDDIRRWVDAGLDVGSHGVSHTPFSDLDPESARRELVESREFLQDITGARVTHFAWPFGGAKHFPDAYVALAKNLGYSAVYSGISRRARKAPPGVVLRRQLALEWGPSICRYMAMRG